MHCSTVALSHHLCVVHLCFPCSFLERTKPWIPGYCLQMGIQRYARKESLLVLAMHWDLKQHCFPTQFVFILARWQRRHKMLRDVCRGGHPVPWANYRACCLMQHMLLSGLSISCRSVIKGQYVFCPLSELLESVPTLLHRQCKNRNSRMEEKQVTKSTIMPNNK